MDSPIESHICSEDPLTEEIIQYLVTYQEEDPCLDYKLEFDPVSEKDWLEITKDICAFANTNGGYLLFGIRNRDKNIVGLEESLSTLLGDANNIIQKVNRHLDPDISSLRSKEFIIDSKRIVGLFIPPSSGVTHLISKDGVFKYPSDKSKILLHKGTFYVRGSAGNHLGDSRDLDSVVERRIEQFRESLMDKVARVVQAPQTSEVFILSKDPTDEEAKRFIIEDSPDSIPIKGMSFTVPPEGIEEEIAAWSVLSRSDSNAIPPSVTLWKWYAERENIEISDEHKLALFVFSVWQGAPAFYWMQELRAQVLQPALIDAIKRRPTGAEVSYMFAISGFLGKGFYKRALSAIGTYRDKLNPRQQQYPSNGPREFCKDLTSKKMTEPEVKELKIDELNEITNQILKTNKEPGLQAKWNAQKIDCYLYARDDRYE